MYSAHMFKMIISNLLCNHASELAVLAGLKSSVINMKISFQTEKTFIDLKIIYTFVIPLYLNISGRAEASRFGVDLSVCEMSGTWSSCLSGEYTSSDSVHIDRM